MDSEKRAGYVHSAVDGRNFKKGEAVSIPIPRRDADVEALLDDLEDNRLTAVEATGHGWAAVEARDGDDWDARNPDWVTEAEHARPIDTDGNEDDGETSDAPESAE